MNVNKKDLTMISLIAAVYVVLTLVVSPLSYGAIQIRFAEMLAVLPFFNRKYALSLIIGCAIANLFSPLGIIDMVFGLGSTVICVLVIGYLPKIWMAVAVSTVVIGFVVGAEIWLIYGVPFWFTVLTVAVGEAIALTIGALVWKVLLKNPKIRQYIQPRKTISV